MRRWWGVEKVLQVITIFLFFLILSNLNMNHYRQKTTIIAVWIQLMSFDPLHRSVDKTSQAEIQAIELKCCLKLKDFNQVGMKHRWSSGRILACHAGDPGSIPGRCTVFLFFFWSSTTSSTLISHYFYFDFCTYIIIIVQPVHCRTSSKAIQVHSFNNNKMRRKKSYYCCLLH